MLLSCDHIILYGLFHGTVSAAQSATVGQLSLLLDPHTMIFT